MAHINVDAYYKAVLHMNEGAYVIFPKRHWLPFSKATNQKQTYPEG
jgi:hypothetical protein